jgi:hypothetical protein
MKVLSGLSLLTGTHSVYWLGYMLDDTGSWNRFPTEPGDFSLFHNVRMALAPIQCPNQWVPGALPTYVKWPGSEADHSTSFIAEVNYAWSYSSIPTCNLMAWRLIKRRGNITIKLLLHKTALILPWQLI